MDMRNSLPAMSLDCTSKHKSQMTCFLFRHLKLLLCDRGKFLLFFFFFAYIQCFPDVIKHMDVDGTPRGVSVFSCSVRGGDLSHGVRIYQPVPDLEF